MWLAHPSKRAFLGPLGSYGEHSPHPTLRSLWHEWSSSPGSLASSRASGQNRSSMGTCGTEGRGSTMLLARSGPCPLPCPQLLPTGERAEQDWPVEDTVGPCPGRDSSGPLPASCECQPGCGAWEALVLPSPKAANSPGAACGGGCSSAREVQGNGGRAGEKEEAELSAHRGA